MKKKKEEGEQRSGQKLGYVKWRKRRGERDVYIGREFKKFEKVRNPKRG